MPCCEIMFGGTASRKQERGRLYGPARDLPDLASSAEWGSQEKNHWPERGMCKISDASAADMDPYFEYIPESGADEPPKDYTGPRYLIRIPEVAQSNGAIYTKAEFSGILEDQTVSTKGRR